MAFFICFASCLILGNADNQQGRGVKCIINYWEGATSLLELILMLLLPLWVMWGVKYFSGERGAAPQHSFAYQINSRARWRCQPRQPRYAKCTQRCTCLERCHWSLLNTLYDTDHCDILSETEVVCVWICINSWWFRGSALPPGCHFWFEASQVNMVMKKSGSLGWRGHKRDFKLTAWDFHVYKFHRVDKCMYSNSLCFYSHEKMKIIMLKGGCL